MKRIIACLCIAALLLPTACAQMPQECPAISVLFVNVGKADAILIEIDDAAYLIDTGSKESAPTLLDALAQRGIERLQGVFLTHTHADHIGGMQALAAYCPIERLYSARISKNKKNGENKIAILGKKLELEHVLLDSGDAVEVGQGLNLEVLGPIVYQEEDDNDNSLVLALTVCGRRFLFTGDMQFAEEIALIEDGCNLRADVLKVGNHGNPDATSNQFASLVSPSVAVISTDTSVDADSANPRVRAALAMAEIHVTEDAVTGVLVEVDTSGNIKVKSLE